jgi:hypothetical protein
VHRGELYSTAVYQRVGFLYAPFNRSAPWWAIHDVVLKMLLTGMLIYVPKEERAGIAIILCMIAIANLNYFRPHKSLLLFWLSQLAFLITSTKYVFATVLSAIDQDGSPDTTARVLTVGTFLIALDVCFILVAIGTICAAALLLRRKIRAQEDERAISSGEAPPNGRTTNATDTNLTRILPVHAAPAVMMGSQQQQENDDDVDDDVDDVQAFPDDEDHVVGTHELSMTRTRSTIAKVMAVQDSYHAHEARLREEHAERGAQQKRRTQLRLLLRTQLRQTRALKKVPAFAPLDEAAISKVVDRMQYKKFAKGDLLCKEGDAADTFYVIMQGQCTVTVGSVRVGKVHRLEFVGETALESIRADGAAAAAAARVRSATVKVESESAMVLSLSRKEFASLVADDTVRPEVVSAMREVREARLLLNRELLEGGASGVTEGHAD